MESHACFHNSLIVGSHIQLSFPVVEADTETKVGGHVQIGIALHDQVLGSHVGGADGLADLNLADEGAQGIVCDHVGLLLLRKGIDEECATGHSRHLTELATHVDVDSLGVELVVTAVNFELVDCETVAGLDLNGQGIL